jgi:clan AA aspartic protease
MFMGLVYAEIEIVNAEQLGMAKRHLLDQDEVKKMKIRVMADSGAWMMCINENIQSIMDLPFIRKEKVRLADGQRVEYDVVGEIEVRFGGRLARCEAVVLPGDTRPLLGAVPMELLNLVIHPQRHELLVSSEEPLLVGIYK